MKRVRPSTGKSEVGHERIKSLISNSVSVMS